MLIVDHSTVSTVNVGWYDKWPTISFQRYKVSPNFHTQQWITGQSYNNTHNTIYYDEQLSGALWCAILNHQWLVHHLNPLVKNWPIIFVMVCVPNRVSYHPHMLVMALQLRYLHVGQVPDWCFFTDHTNRHAHKLYFSQITQWFQVKCDDLTHCQ